MQRIYSQVADNNGQHIALLTLRYGTGTRKHSSDQNQPSARCNLETLWSRVQTSLWTD
jgi:hypothetical protein